MKFRIKGSHKSKIYLFSIIFFVFTDVSSALAERLTIIAPKANIRSGPGANYEVLWEAEQYYPVSILKKEGEWYQFKDFEGDKGWIHEKLLGKDVSSIITKMDKCNVRSGPGNSHEILFSTEKGIPFKVIGKKGEWLNVLHSDGDKGWIHQSLIW